MASEKFCLRWNDFESNISVAFRELRDDKDFFDVTLACDDEQIQAHKVILSACSPFFRTVLRRNPHAHPLLYLKGVKYTDLQSVLNFMYHGEVNVAQEELNSFLAVAEELRVKGLTQSQSGGAASATAKDHSFPSAHAQSKPPQNPQNRDPLPPPKRPRPSAPLPPPPSNHHHSLQPDDDIQEVVPVKSEPRDPVPQIPVHPHPSQQQASMYALQPTEDPEMAGYGAEGEGYDEDYGQYEGAGYEAGDSADGNKGYVETFLEVGDSRIRCVECEKTFTNIQNARRHVRSLHGDSGGFSCSICDVSLINNRTYNDHMREKHNVYRKGKYNSSKLSY